MCLNGFTDLFRVNSIEKKKSFFPPTPCGLREREKRERRYREEKGDGKEGDKERERGEGKKTIIKQTFALENQIAILRGNLKFVI